MSGEPARLAPEAASKVSGWDMRRETIARHIESVALNLFSKEGVERVTVEKIAAAAGISERTFFRYFASREDILIALPSRELARLSAAIEARPADEDILTAFKAAVRRAGAATSEGEHTFLWGRVMLRSPAAGAAAMGRLHPSMTECFEALIAARLPEPARTAGHAGPLAAAVGGVVGHVYVRWITGGGQGDLGVAIEAAFDALSAHLPMPRSRRRRSAPSLHVSD